MAECYDGQLVWTAQQIDDVGQPIGPPINGLPHEFVEKRPELAWMMNREVSGPNIVKEHPIVWVTVEGWDDWREHKDDL